MSFETNRSMWNDHHHIHPAQATTNHGGGSGGSPGYYAPPKKEKEQLDEAKFSTTKEDIDIEIENKSIISSIKEYFYNLIKSFISLFKR